MAVILKNCILFLSNLTNLSDLPIVKNPIVFSQKDMCCSDYPISFHYVKPHEMYLVEYWLYHGKVHGKETGRVPWPKIVK